MRFLLPVAAALGCSATFTGQGRLPERPVSPLREALLAHGCQLDRALLPIKLSGQLSGGVFSLPGNVSSQFLTGLLLCFPLLKEGGEIVLTTPLESSGYVEMTIHTLSCFGVDVERTAQGFRVAPRPALPFPGHAYYLRRLVQRGILAVRRRALRGDYVPKPGGKFPQGDRAVEEILKSMGAGVERQGGAVTVRPAPLLALRIDAGEIPDLIPVLAAVAAAAQGQTHIVNAARLRIKESDRLHAIWDTLSRLGADIRQQPDGLVITGKPRLLGGEVSSFGDHRIAMSAAIASSAAKKML